LKLRRAYQAQLDDLGGFLENIKKATSVKQAQKEAEMALNRIEYFRTKDHEEIIGKSLVE